MSELNLPEPILAMCERGKVTAADVAELRNQFELRGEISLLEAESLFALDRSARQKCAEWQDFFVETLVDFIVYQEEPEGSISPQNSEWLIHCISQNGIVDSPQRLEMLVAVIETSRGIPQSLIDLAIAQVSQAAHKNQGPLASNRAGNGILVRLLKALEVSLRHETGHVPFDRACHSAFGGGVPEHKMSEETAWLANRLERDSLYDPSQVAFMEMIRERGLRLVEPAA